MNKQLVDLQAVAPKSIQERNHILGTLDGLRTGHVRAAHVFPWHRASLGGDRGMPMPRA